MKNLWIFIVVLSFSSATRANEDYVKDYYPYINKAELAIVDGHYKMALEIYKATFDKVGCSFSKDIYNATVCAAKVHDYKQAFVFLDSLIAKGVAKYFFEKDKGLSALRASGEWSDFIKSYAQKRKTTFINSRHKGILAQLIRLEEADQLFRLKEGSYKKYGDTITAIDNRNMDTLMMVWEQYGFPGEWLVGTERPRNVYAYPDIVLWHHCQNTATKGKRNLTNELRQAVREGQIYPFHFGLLMCAVNDKNYNLNSCGLVVLVFEEQTSYPLVEKLTTEKLNSVNQLRLAAGLETLADFNRKAAFAIKGGIADDFAFEHYGRPTTVDLPTQRHFDGLKNNAYTEVSKYL